MARARIEMSKEAQDLYNQNKLLVKRANQRILELERLTGEKRFFCS